MLCTVLMQIKPFYRTIPLSTTYFDELAILLGLFMISDGCHVVVSVDFILQQWR